MEGTTETSRMKHHMNWLLGKNDRGDDNEAKEDDPKPRMDPKKKKDETYVYCSRKKKHGQKVRSLFSCHESSVLSIVSSLNNNCCICLGAIMRYIRAVFSCLSCIVMCHVPKMEFQRLFCELVEACGDACIDIMCCIRKALHLCIGSDN